MKKTILPIFIFFFFSFKTVAQCDQYYLVGLLSGSDSKCYFKPGSPVRFCPTLKGVSIDGKAFDTHQWEGYDPQYITLKKNGGLAGSCVLKIKEKELFVNLNGCEQRTYSISFDPVSSEDISSFKNELIEKEAKRSEFLKKEQEDYCKGWKDGITRKITKEKLDAIGVPKCEYSPSGCNGYKCGYMAGMKKAELMNKE